MPRLLTVEDLRLELPGEAGPLRPVDGVSYHIDRGECVGLVGESGCGKSLGALTLLGLTRELPRAKISGMAELVRDKGKPVNLLRLSEHELTRVRGGDVAMVFQDPLSALNPLLRIDYQIGEVLRRHRGLKGKAAFAQTVALLKSVGVPQPEQRARQYPHQLSGGLRQRALIALSLAGEPSLLIADEPTTALDVTIQAQILTELKALRERRGLSILFITHDLGVVAQLCTRVLVMYAGRIVEEAPVDEFFRAPRHPYSRGLLNSLPTMGGGRERLTSIPGNPPRPGHFPPGCRFQPRCSVAVERCAVEYPELSADGERRCACFVAAGEPEAVPRG